MQERQVQAYQALRQLCADLCERPDFFFTDETRDQLIEALVICTLAETEKHST
jgi:hypothetical protein